MSQNVYDMVANAYGPFEIDLFASRLNNKMQCYCAWKPDPHAKFIDAFCLDWKDYTFYAFPPFSVVMRTLTKICSDHATGVLICPLWPTQPWFPKLMELLTNPPILLPPNCLFLPFKPNKIHEHKNLRLLACPLSGNTTLVEEFRSRLGTSCAPLGEETRVANMKAILESGFLSVVKGKLIPFRSMKLKS